MSEILHNVYIGKSRGEVFDAVTNPAKIDDWWTKECSGTPEIGESYRLYFAPDYDWRARVSKGIPEEQFELKMTSADKDWSPTTFGFILKDEREGTLMSFYHTGWKESNDHFRQTSFCWAILLNNLKKYLEQGVIVPFEQRDPTQ